MDNNSIKNNIRNLRIRKGLTQEEMAHGLGISLTAYRDLERGSTSIVNGNIWKIAELTGTTSEEVMLGYLPEQSDCSIEDVKTEYGNRMDVLQTRINDLEKIVASLEQTIDSKNEIIAMLKKNLGEER